MGVRYFQGDRSPNDAERKAKGCSSAWMHHKGRNRHHFEYWTDYLRDGSGIGGVEMPEKYVAEMFCDRLAASKVYRGKDFAPGDPYAFFLKGKNRRLLVLETMKMEYRLRSPLCGNVMQIAAVPEQRVTPEDVLLTIEA